MFLERRYSTFKIDYSRCSTAFRAELVPIREHFVNYKNHFFGLILILRRTQFVQIVKTDLGERQLTYKGYPLKRSLLLSILTEIGTCRQILVKIPDVKFHRIWPVEFSLIRASSRIGRQINRNAMLILASTGCFTNAPRRNDINIALIKIQL